jgi:hypothetical protein
MCHTCENQRTFGELVELPELLPVQPMKPAVAPYNPNAYGKPADCDDCDDCDDCEDGEETVTCCNCGNDAGRDARTSNAGDVYCDDCYSDAFYCCDRCCDEITADDARTDFSHRRYDVLCGGCFDQLFVTCDGCGETESQDSSHNVNGDTYCDSCYCDRFFYCEGCNEDCSTDDYHSDGYCDACYNENNNNEYDARRFNPIDNTFERTGSGRTFGVELETSSCDGHYSFEGDYHFGACEDGSIDGMEFVSAVLRGDKGLDAIHEFCDAANNAGFEVDNKCGFHLHIGVDDLTDQQRRNVAAAYRLTYSVWSAFVSRERRANSYCGKSEWGIDDVLNCDDFYDFCDAADRYQWFNLAAYTEHRTFEIRLHSATLNGNKVANWVVAHVRFIDAVANMSLADIRAAFEGKSTRQQFAALARLWNCESLAAFYAKRAEKFGATLAPAEVAAN